MNSYYTQANNFGATGQQLAALREKYGQDMELDMYLNYFRVETPDGELLAKASTIEELLA